MSINAVVAIIDVISALCDVKCFPCPSTFDPDEKITLLFFRKAKQKTCVALPLSIEASVAITSCFLDAKLIILYNDRCVNLDSPHMCRFHFGDNRMFFCIASTAQRNL